MLFNSLHFMLFYPVAVIIYFLTPYRYRWLPLLVAGGYFYRQSEPLYLSILAISTLVDYICGLRLAKTANKNERKYYLAISLIFNLGLLAVFRYLGFFTGLPLFMNIAVPLGLSYYTFKKMSYVIDIYRGNLEPEPHFGIFALYVSFFPQVTAGPIDRARDLISQFKQRVRFDAAHYPNLTGGLKLMAWGFFKKIVVADRLAIFVNQVYGSPFEYRGISLITAAFFFSIQVYADFSGYTDLAVGMAQVMGIKTADNFNRPYSAISIADFWRRWHITLTTWLRDYIFLPIVYPASRKMKPITVKLLGLEITGEAQAYVVGVTGTMLLCGLWHGASWTFIVWGGLHGLYLALSFVTRKTREKLRKRLIPKKWKYFYRYLRVLFTFLAVTFLWIFFRASSLAEARYIITHLFTGLGDLPSILADGKSFQRMVMLGQPGKEFILALAAPAAMFLVNRLQPQEGIGNLFSQKPLLVRWALYILLIMAIMNFGVFDEVPFIYSQY